ncbi:hypothetical protein [Effusibacillus consociatus]|uniref:Uncharacterized protein n=1 Tax=Effusibacillus consociatus TaxID=1117041 RepID=A0ABV9PYM6_9BACL
MKKKALLSSALSTALVATAIGAPTLAKSDDKSTDKRAVQVMQLNPQTNPAKAGENEQIQESIKKGDVQTAKPKESTSVEIQSTTEQVGIEAYSKLFDFTFEGVSYTGMNSRNFDVTGTDVEIDSRAWTSNGENKSGTYYITLYRNHWYGDDKLTTVKYFYGPDKTIYYYQWTGVGKGSYHFNIKCEETLISGDGSVLQQ